MNQTRSERKQPSMGGIHLSSLSAGSAGISKKATKDAQQKAIQKNLFSKISKLSGSDPKTFTADTCAKLEQHSVNLSQYGLTVRDQPFSELVHADTKDKGRAVNERSSFMDSDSSTAPDAPSSSFSNAKGKGKARADAPSPGSLALAILGGSGGGNGALSISVQGVIQAKTQSLGPQNSSLESALGSNKITGASLQQVDLPWSASQQQQQQPTGQSVNLMALPMQNRVMASRSGTSDLANINSQEESTGHVPTQSQHPSAPQQHQGHVVRHNAATSYVDQQFQQNPPAQQAQQPIQSASQSLSSSQQILTSQPELQSGAHQAFDANDMDCEENGLEPLQPIASYADSAQTHVSQLPQHTQQHVYIYGVDAGRIDAHIEAYSAQDTPQRPPNSSSPSLHGRVLKSSTSPTSSKPTGSSLSVATALIRSGFRGFQQCNKVLQKSAKKLTANLNPFERIARHRAQRDARPPRRSLAFKASMNKVQELAVEPIPRPLVETLWRDFEQLETPMTDEEVGYAQKVVRQMLQHGHHVYKNVSGVDVNAHWDEPRILAYAHRLPSDAVALKTCTYQLYDLLHRADDRRKFNASHAYLFDALAGMSAAEGASPTHSTMQQVLDALEPGYNSGRDLHYRQKGGDGDLLDWDREQFDTLLEWLRSLPGYMDAAMRKLVGEVKWRTKQIWALLHTPMGCVPQWPVL